MAPSGDTPQRVTLAQALELAVEQHSAGRLAEAEDIYRKILAAVPTNHDALHLLGLIENEKGNNEQAAELIERAIAISPDVGEMHGNLALVLQDLGRLGDAVARFDKALALNPEFAEGHNNLGLIQQDLGRLEDAVASFERALAIDPGFAEAHSNLGAALAETGALEDALEHHRKAVSLNPANDTFWMVLAACVARLSFAGVDEDFLRLLLDLLDHPAVDPQIIAPAVLDALRHHPDMAAALNGDTSYDAAAKLAAIPLLRRLMALSTLKDLAVETVLTAFRRSMLDGAMDDRDPLPGALPFAAALAHHCFLNEYVFAETDAERELVERLENRIAHGAEQNGRPSPHDIAVLAAYRPLHGYRWAAALQDGTWPDDVSEVVTRQVTEPLTEQALRLDMPQMTPVADAVSQSVQAQYEENPYPRWTKFPAQQKPKSIGSLLRDAPLRFEAKDYRSPERPDILIAGCGTGYQPLLAAYRYANARILAVDLSLASLAYARRKTREAGVDTIDFAQADILGLGEMDREFDLIECVGVLHHLAEPLAGWEILAGLLRPGGVMKVGLYSEAARRDVVAARALIAECGFEATPDGIRRCRAEIQKRARSGDAEMTSIAERNSFFTASECRDLLFHVQEHRFTLPQIEEALTQLDMKFLGFEMGPATISDFRRAHPGQLASLAHWHRYEQTHPDTFRGMYQFWAQKA